MTRKQTSDRVSRIAARVLAKCRSEYTAAADQLGLADKWYEEIVTIGELKALCASVLSQDETKGKRKKRRK